MTESIFEGSGIGIPADDETAKLLGEIDVFKIFLKSIETINEMVMVTDAPDKIGDEKIIYVNSAFEKVTQYSREEIVGKSPSVLQGPDTDREVIDELVEKLSRGEHFEGETFNYRKDGSTYRVRWSIDPIRNEEGEITHFVSVQRDVTEEWNQRKQLEEVINERETLVKETHHRIKNNLATITGLLELQAMKSDSEEVRKVLSDSMNRVKSIASLHEKLYETEGLSSIQLDLYIKDLVDQLASSLNNLGRTSEIDFELDLEAVTLGTRQAVPLGLIVNELITNAHKHAFDDDEENGMISVSCKTEDEKIHLQVSDNGKGLPDDIEKLSADSLGLNLIETLCAQLDADHEFISDNGTRFTMTFGKTDLHEKLNQD